MLDSEPQGGDTTGATGADTAAEKTTAVRRTRTTRRRAAEAGAAEPPQPTPAAEDAPAAKTTRRRRKAAEPDIPLESGTSAPEAPKSPEGVPAPRTRRRKAAAEPEASAPRDTRAAGSPAEHGAGDEATAAEPGTRAGRRRAAALSAPSVLFMAPEADVAPVPAKTAKTAKTARKRAKAAAEQPVVEEAPAPPEEVVETGRTRKRRSRRTAEETVTAAEPVEAETPPLDEAGDEDDVAGHRRRRRGRRGRGRGKGTADEFADEAESVAEPADDEEAAAEEEGDQLTRRRRRRRRKGASGDADVTAEDGVPTVVKIREPRAAADEVRGVTGSTRLEAKRQRRRDGREQRRTRPPILSESEFLARREAVDRVMVVRHRGDRTQIAVLEDGVLVEHYVTRASAATMAGNVYLGKVQNVLPSMEAAFVDVGRGRNAVLYAGEVNWDASGLEGRARSIEQALKSGDSVLVQVTKDPVGHKGARLTSHVALSGRHLVYVPHGNASGISRKLPDTERKRLREVLKKLVPDGAGVIVRTAAEGASEDELARDVKRLQAQWEDIQAKSSGGSPPVLLYEEPDLLIRVVRDLFNEDFRELVIQGDTAYEMVDSYLSHVSPDLVARLRRHTGTDDVFADKRIDEQILKGLDRKVFLPSGGHLVIDRTEAMTVIDVNTGKYTGAGGNLEETVTRNNLEAAEEIVRQLRLRDLGGIIVIDFIDMVLESNRELVLRRLTECLGRDRTKHQVTEITSLGLVQMTRKRIGQGLLEAFSEACEVCKGRGLIIHTEPVPEKGRPAANGNAAGSAAVKAVAAASRPEGTGRRRARKAAEPAALETPAAPVSEDDDDDELPDPDALTATLDDAYEGEGLDADDEEPLLTSTRRRNRRGGSRRRTRP
jgi:ribonuclease E